ncbi:Eco57I restriction-modification methylase domain-containing protein [Kitasatospora cinereorecta]|uniref:site-specific DNA-methyltransferase (adenine-specific) n=1 Tax=Kitasatospora cinereorecta TaxID=285560 RepID=A0ABW0V7W9_9ACTN
MSPVRTGTGRRPGPPSVDPKQQHLAWLSLVEVTGPFLTLPVLVNAWHSLDGLEKEARDQLRFEHGLWQTDAAANQQEWTRYVLRDLLEWGDALDTGPARLDALALDVPDHAARLVPSFVLDTPGAPHGAAPELLGLVCENGTQPTARIKGSDWSATPVDRMAQLCRHHGVQLGLVTDGRWWALVWAPRGGVTTTAVFDAVAWPEQAERDVVRAFRSLLRRSRFFGVPDAEKLTALLDESTRTQEDVTEALGVRVRQAVELLVDAIGRADNGIDAHDAYRGAVAVMMRLVFLLFAEERRLLPADNAIYAGAYSAGGLYEQLEEQARTTASESALRYSTAAWHRLVALFNAVYYGIDHPQLSMPSYDGSIFDPATYPWLAGGLAIDDQTVLHILDSVQYVEIGTGRAKERRRLSFRALDVEQIGYVYEGLLSFDGQRAIGTVLGLTGKSGQEEEVPLTDLEKLARPYLSGGQVADVAGLAGKLAETYKESGLGTARAVEKRLAPLGDPEREIALGRLASACNGDRALAEQILPFYPLIRTDLRGLPVVILPGTIYVTESKLRKNTGTHYTPRFLAEQVAKGALQPLMYEVGPLQTADETQWQPKTASRILELKVADIAMGSAAFLVAACRYMARFLVDAWSREGDEQARAFLESDLTSGQAVDAEADPVMIRARRQIIEHCLYGSDINPAAVEMAKLSLWLVSMDPHRPFTFLDDRLVAGDSLLGITSLEQLEWMHIDPAAGRKLHTGTLLDFTAGVRARVNEATGARSELAKIDGDTLKHLAEKRELLAEAKQKTEELSFYADLVIGAALASAVKKDDVPWYRFDERGDADQRARRDMFLEAAHAAERAAAQREDAMAAARELAAQWLEIDRPAASFDRSPVHWPLVFPEVFARGGFDAVIGNPPFLGGLKISEAAGDSYREYLVTNLANGVRGTRGTGDLVAYFALRAHSLINVHGQSGLLATNTLAQGDTRQVGLEQIVAAGAEIRASVKSERWPSKSAVLEYCAVWTSRVILGENASRICDGLSVSAITPSLDPASRVTWIPQRLKANESFSFQGSNILGLGFTIAPDAARDLIKINPRNADVLFPYLNGQDINTRPDSSASRWVINFHDWPEERAAAYPECYEQVLQLVKPERAKNNQPSRREKWWQYSEYRRGLAQATSRLQRVIVMARISKSVMPILLRNGQVFNEKTVIFATDSTAMLAFLSSAIHYWWAIANSSTMKADLNYSPTSVFETLPRPALHEEMRALGDRLDTSRRALMLSRSMGLTATYNLVHNPTCLETDIVELRELHQLIDEAVCRAYGWDDLLMQGLGHGHHETRQGSRFTIASTMQVLILDRLRELNQERYEEELAAGAHSKGKATPAKVRQAKPVDPAQEAMF